MWSMYGIHADSDSQRAAAVQLYARSGQLATANTLYLRGKSDDYRCALGCQEVGDAHHLFVNCTTYGEWRESAHNELLAETDKKLGLLLREDNEVHMKIKKTIEPGIKAIAKSLFIDNSTIWPLHKTSYYLGNQPSLAHVLTEVAVPSEILRRRITTNLMMDWHTRCIKLAGRIFGDYQRRMAVTNGCRKKVA